MIQYSFTLTHLRMSRSTTQGDATENSKDNGQDDSNAKEGSNILPCIGGVNGVFNSLPSGTWRTIG